MAKSREQNTEYRRKMRRERVAWALEYLGGQCVSCGSKEKLEIDHIVREGKEFMPVRRCGDVSFERFKAEVDKCQLLCNLCHIEKTRYEVYGWEFPIYDPWEDDSEFEELWTYIAQESAYCN